MNGQTRSPSFIRKQRRLSDSVFAPTSPSPVSRAFNFRVAPASPDEGGAYTGNRTPSRRTSDGQESIARPQKWSHSSQRSSPHNEDFVASRSKTRRCSLSQLQLDDIAAAQLGRRGAKMEQPTKRVVIDEPKPHEHFRPMRYEITTEIDRLFGTSQRQRRELALRVRDENGALWFDEIEMQENEQLLGGMGSPVTPRRPASRRSSSATASLPPSPLDFTTQRLYGLHPCSPSGLTLPDYAALPLYPGNSMSHLSASQAADRRRKRNHSALDAGNIVDDSMGPTVRRLAENVNDDELITGSSIPMPAFLPIPRLKSTKSDFDEAFVGSQDASVPVAKGLGDHLDKKGVRRPAQLQLRASNNDVISSLRGHSSNSRPSRPLSIDGAASEGRDPFSSRLDARQSPVSTGCLTPLSGVQIRRRGSSLDMSPSTRRRFARMEIASPSQSPSAPSATGARTTQRSSPLHSRHVHAHAYPPTLERRRTTAVDANRVADVAALEQTKAASRLGITAMNANLLVPGGLGTGEHVYDGIEILCRSVHLTSDDEDDDSAEYKNDSSSGLGRLGRSSKRRMKKWFTVKKEANL